MSTPTMALETITPARARELLQTNIANNRTLRATHVSRLAADMAAGRWNVASSPIMISDGEVMDGQHRLSAVVESDTTVQMWVMRNVPRDALVTIDTGLGRNFRDVLRFERPDVRDPGSLSAIASRTYTFQASNGLFNYTDTRKQPTRYELLNWFDTHRVHIEAAHQLSARPYEAIRLHRAGVAVVAFAASKAKLLDEIEEFIDIVVTGDAEQGNGARALRDWWISKVAKNQKMTPLRTGPYVVSAWNRWVTGEQVSMLKVLTSQRGGARRSPVIDSESDVIFPFSGDEGVR